MNIEIRSIVAAGDIRNERITFRATTNLDIGDYIFAQSEYLNKGISVTFNITYYFPYKNILKGDLVVLYTKSGVIREKELDSGKKAHFFYIGMDDAIWDRDDRAAVVFHVEEWTFLPKHEIRSASG